MSEDHVPTGPIAELGSGHAREVSYAPTAGLSYDPSESKYWDKDALQGEVTRAFEVCHGCRMCFKYCDSFPTLFSLIDQKHDGDARKLTNSETASVMDACFQCKLCEVQCPYTPRDQHPFLLDFPKLVHRWKAVRAVDEGTRLRDKVLGNPEATASLARASFGIANVMNRVGLHRLFMEKVLGVHRDKLLPDFAPTSFERLAKRKGAMDVAGPVEAVLFQTCYVDGNEPQVGLDTLEVLRHNGVAVRCVEGLQCCGMPAWEHGDLEGLRERARRNLDLLIPFVEKGAKVLAINPTCSMMLRREWPELLDGEDRARAKVLAEATRDVSEYLWSLRDEERFKTDFRSTPGEKVSVHAPCHLRAQGVGFKGRDLIKKIPGVSTTLVSECCGHDGTYAMTVEGFEPSKRIGQRAFSAMQEPGAEVWATDCPLAALQFQQHAGTKPMHPMTVLALAYREDGFPAKVPKKEDG